MKSLSAFFLILALAFGSIPAMAEDTYTLTRGSQWRGVQIGEQPPRTLDTVCENDLCYPLNTQQLLSREMTAKYGIRKPSFEALAGVESVERRGDTLILPADLGREVFMLEFWNRDENDGDDMQ